MNYHSSSNVQKCYARAVSVTMGNMRVTYNRSTKWILVESSSNQWTSAQILQHQFTRTLNGKITCCA